LTVEVWEVALEREDALVRRLALLLTAEERERAGRLRRPGASARWTVARAALRIVLGARLGRIPEEVEFAVRPHGKPELPGEGLCFNLSHSGERALIAMADVVEVGIDVERPGRNVAAVERTLTEGERASGAPPLQIWCRKEALAKAIGGGLDWAPEQFDTSRPEGFVLIDLALDGGYTGALAVAAEAADVAFYRLAL
jgi:4'-phosphopantetheinyl transferase